MICDKLLGDRIKHYRQQRGLTQAELANGICHRSYISKYESNTVVPNQITLQQLKERLKIQHIPLTEEEMSSFRNELKEWGLLVRNSLIAKAEEQRERLHKIVHEIQDTELLLLFQISALKIHLKNERLDDAKNVWEWLLPYESELQDSNLYYFYFYGGLFYFLIGDLKAAHFLKKAVELDNSLNINDSGLYYALCNYYSMQGRHVISFFYCELALKKMQYSNEIFYNHFVELFRAFNYNILGQHCYAEKMLKGLLVHAENINNKLLLYNVYHTLGCVYTDAKCYDLGYDSFYKAFDYCEENDIYAINNILYIVYLFDKSQDDLNMHKWLTKGIELAKSMNYTDWYIQLITVEHIQNLKNLESLSYIENTSIPHIIRLKEFDKAAEYCKRLAEFYYDKHNFKKAYKYSSMANEYMELIFKGDDIL